MYNDWGGWPLRDRCDRGPDNGPAVAGTLLAIGLCAALFAAARLRPRPWLRGPPRP